MLWKDSGCKAENGLRPSGPLAMEKRSLFFELFLSAVRGLGGGGLLLTLLGRQGCHFGHFLADSESPGSRAKNFSGFFWPGNPTTFHLESPSVVSDTPHVCDVHPEGDGDT